MLPIASTPPAEQARAAEAEAPRHLLRSIRRLSALYDELNAIVEQARAQDPAPRR